MVPARLRPVSSARRPIPPCASAPARATTGLVLVKRSQVSSVCGRSNRLASPARAAAAATAVRSPMPSERVVWMWYAPAAVRADSSVHPGDSRRAGRAGNTNRNNTTPAATATGVHIFDCRLKIEDLWIDDCRLEIGALIADDRVTSPIDNRQSSIVNPCNLQSSIVNLQFITAPRPPEGRRPCQFA